MNENSAKRDTKLDYLVQFINDSEVAEEVGEAVASVLSNPLVTWAKFILTDDQPNGNKMRVPFEEFDNIIKTGSHMPVKMAEGDIEDHDNSKPLGVIAHIKKDVIDGVNVLVALAALWADERPADVNHIKHLMNNNEDVNVSWELKYAGSSLNDGIKDLLNVKMKAATIVRKPAYKGRTRFLAVASAEEWSEPYLETLPDANFLYVEAGGEQDSEGRTTPLEKRHFPYKNAAGNIDATRLKSILDTEVHASSLSEETLNNVRTAAQTLLSKLESGEAVDALSENIITEESTVDIKELEVKLQKAEADLEAANTKLQEQEALLGTAQASVSTLEAEKASLETEVVTLREFKNAAEAAEAKAEKLAGIKAKFAAASIEKDEKYFEDNGDKLLALEESELDFMLQELSAFASKTTEAAASQGGTKVPNVPGSLAKTKDIKELAKALRERNSQ